PASTASSALRRSDGPALRERPAGLEVARQEGARFGPVDRSRLGSIDFGVVGPRRYALGENPPPDRPGREPRRRENAEGQLPGGVPAGKDACSGIMNYDISEH